MMQRADLDYGYGRLSLALVDAISASDLSKQEMKVIWAVFRATYCIDAGKNPNPDGPRRLSKSLALLSGSQIGKYSGLDRSNANKAVKALLEAKLLRRKGDKIGFNPDVAEWTVKKIGSGDILDLTEVETTSGKKRKRGRNNLAMRLKQPQERGRNNLTNTQEDAVDKGILRGSLDSVDIDDPIAVADHVKLQPFNPALVNRLVILHKGAIPGEALRQLAAFRKQPIGGDVLETWLREALDHVEQRIREGVQFRRPRYVIVFEEIQKAMDRDKHERYGYPREVYKGRKVFFKPDGEPCDCNGIPMNYHPAHPDYAEFYGPGPPVFEQPF